MSQGLALFGGTFNPPHKGHVAALQAVAEQLKPKKILVMPTGDPVHKALPQNTPSAAHRLAMTRLAFGAIPRVEVSDWEMKRALAGHTGYTVDTLETLRETYMDLPLWLVVGQDMFLTLQDWKNAERIFALCSVASLARGEGQLAEMARHAEGLKNRFGAEAALLRHDLVEISSFDLRAMLAGGAGLSFVPDAVAAYIQTNNLYGV